MNQESHTTLQNAAIAETIAIVGVGLLGASLGLAVKKAGLCGRVIGIGRADSPSLEQAKQIGAIDEGFVDPAAGAATAQIVVLAANVGQFPALMDQLRPALAPGALVTDVGSTKVRVMRWAARHLPDTCDFIGSHPMAGSEKRGPLAARADLYQNALCLLCAPVVRGRGNATPSRISAAIAKADALWRGIGMRTLQLDARQHDSWVAAISHLPHAVAVATVLAAARTPQAFPAIAGGFMDTTRVAGGDPAMWADIFLTNRGPARREITEMIRNLKKLQSAISSNDRARVLDILQQARTLRADIAASRAALNTRPPSPVETAGGSGHL